ncbi:unnamed protein product [Oncorhynchus mykiss]|uniref:Bcl-2 Bcl-2 homology region 1-3 domain-containing protein n=1 Tax=Oncorhynchus mykiss TaxID=8022 RepID=A0A060XRU7_ONCMY|nr:unnamed protein product [Oncorhynchus mykiss]
MTSKNSYWNLVEKVFEDGQITWERIAVLFYVAGRIAVKVVIAHLPELVKDILKWTLEYFRSKLLDWIQKHGGWMNSFAALARVQVERISSMSARSSGLILVFLGGVIMGNSVKYADIRYVFQCDAFPGTQSHCKSVTLVWSFVF